jgi:hypothetical protein
LVIEHYLTGKNCIKGPKQEENQRAQTGRKPKDPTQEENQRAQIGWPKSSKNTYGRGKRRAQTG